MGFNGTGTVIGFDSGFCAEILDISGPGGSRISIPMSHMGTSGEHVFEPGDLIDWGELTISIAFIPATEPPLDGASEAITLTFPDSAASIWTFNGFMTGFTPTTPLEGRATADCTIKVTGAVSIT